jgi:hypothetical protein
VRIIQYQGPNKQDIIDNLFTGVQKGIEHDLFNVEIEGNIIGSILCEQLPPVVQPHMYIKPEFRRPDVLANLGWIFQKVIAPLYSALGFKLMASNCAIDDRGTRTFFEKSGFTTQEVCIATYPLA